MHVNHELEQSKDCDNTLITTVYIESYSSILLKGTVYLMHNSNNWVNLS